MVKKKYCFTIDWLDRIYINSQIVRLIETFWEGAKINFKYSFLRKITEIKEENNLVIFDNSRFVRWSLDIYKKWKYRLVNYPRISTTMDSIQEIKKGLYFFPIKTGSIIVVTVISVNILLSILLHKEIRLLGWIMRGLVLFIGLNGLSSQANWEDIKKTGFFLKRINK